MPFHSYTIRAGSTNRSVLLFGRNVDGSPAVGIDPGLARGGYTRDTDAAAEALPAGALIEVDRDLVPGVYRLPIPDAALAPAALRAVVVVQHPEAIFEPVEIALVAFDPLDSVRLGMTALGPEERIAALSGAFPRLAALELREREAMGSVD